MKGDWNLYQREHETLLMCLNMKDARWYVFDTERTRTSGVS